MPSFWTSFAPRIVCLALPLAMLCIPAVIYIPSTHLSLAPSRHPRILQAAVRPLATQRQSQLRCVRVTRGGQSREGLGAVINRNQLALFLASWYNIPLQFPVKQSVHGYQLNEVFGLCPGITEHPEETAKTGENEPCTLYMKQMLLPVCPPGDCQCLFDGVAPYIEPHLAAGCREISVMNDGFKTVAYSGCLAPVLNRYLAGEAPKPAWEYDAIHYRQGDLADRKGGNGKTFRKRDLYNVVKTMCRESERDIVLVTEGAPTVAKCGDRVVLAGNTTIQDAFRIMKHARTITVGISTFAVAMMEVATPQRMVMRETDMAKYEWIDCQKWSIISRDGGTFHFETKDAMVAHVYSPRQLRNSARRSDAMIEKDIFTESVPKRVWSKNMMRPAALK